MTIIPLNNQGRTQGFTHRARITHADLTETTADTAQVIDIYTAKKGTTVMRVATFVRATFEDTEDAAFNTTLLEVGDDDDVDRYLVEQELNVNGSEVVAKAGTGTLHTYVAAAPGAILQAKFQSMSAKSLVAINKGIVDIFFAVSETGEASADSLGA